MRAFCRVGQGQSANFLPRGAQPLKEVRPPSWFRKPQIKRRKVHGRNGETGYKKQPNDYLREPVLFYPVLALFSLPLASGTASNVKLCPFLHTFSCLEAYSFHLFPFQKNSGREFWITDIRQRLPAHLKRSGR